MSEKKLFTVTASIEFQMPVLAENASKALKIALANVEDEAANFMPADWDITAVEGAKFTDDVYDSLCYGADGDETVTEAMARLGLKDPVQEWAERQGLPGPRPSKGRPDPARNEASGETTEEAENKNG